MLKNSARLAFGFLLSVFSTAGSATDLNVGQSYDGLIELGSWGSRKQFILPETKGKWVLIGEEETALQLSSTKSAGSVNTKVGDYSWVELVNDAPRTLLQVRTTTKPAADAAWPNVCKSAPETVYKNEFFRGALKEKCLLVDAAPAAALSNREKNLLAGHIKSGQTLRPLRAGMTIYNRYDGFLEITVSSLIPAEGSASDLQKALVDWSVNYAELLEDAIRHALEFKAVPTVPSSDAPVFAKTKPLEPSGASAPARSTDGDVFEKLEKLKSLRDKGIISDEEFNSKKQELLKRL